MPLTDKELEQALWETFLDTAIGCHAEYETGNRPCDDGVYCDRCHAEWVQAAFKQFYEESIEKHKFILEIDLDGIDYLLRIVDLEIETLEDVLEGDPNIHLERGLDQLKDLALQVDKQRQEVKNKWQI